MTKERAKKWLDIWATSQSDPEAHQVLLAAFLELLEEIADGEVTHKV